VVRLIADEVQRVPGTKLEPGTCNVERQCALGALNEPIAVAAQNGVENASRGG
jgi:hypothetical protein